MQLTDNHFKIKDEKGRDWFCISVSKEEGEGDNFGEKLSRLGGEPLEESLTMVVLYCDNREDLKTNLSDQID